MFFADMQRTHKWKSLKYRFTCWQQKAWKALIDQVKQYVNSEEDESDEKSDDEKGSEKEGSNNSNNDNDNKEYEDDTDEDEVATEEGKKLKQLSKIQKVCLDFCIELLNQSISWREYDSALICALTVLSVKKDSWKGLKQYPPILLTVIKVARFMMVQQVLKLLNLFKENELNESDGSTDSLQPHKPHIKECLQFIQDMMNRFMVQDSHSLMQWMLNLHMYELKIHYNMTLRGHVE